jgi:cytosine/adenosine deaminase-related metal-dependent hydrolase
VFSAGAPDVHHVVVGGQPIVRDGVHQTIDVPRALEDAITAVRA